jgi:hypothetical protein
MKRGLKYPKKKPAMPAAAMGDHNVPKQAKFVVER